MITIINFSVATNGIFGMQPDADYSAWLTHVGTYEYWHENKTYKLQLLFIESIMNQEWIIEWINIYWISVIKMN